MKIGLIHAALAFLFFGSVAGSQGQKPQEADSSSELQTVTLYSPNDKLKEVPGETKACFSFSLGTYARCVSKDSDLDYGFLRMNVDDWFRLSMLTDSRSVIRNLGELNWTKSFKVPKLEPRPEVKPGKVRNLVIGGEDGVFATQMSAMVEFGHIYVMHVKKTDFDFYVLFRVENFAPDQFCKITWKRIQEPGKKTK